MAYQIEPSDRLLRRIPKKPSHINNGRITSACFKTRDGEDGLSVDIENLVSTLPEIYSSETHRLAAIMAQLPMDEGYDCQHDPVEGNYSHALIVGNTRPIAKKLARACELID